MARHSDIWRDGFEAGWRRDDGNTVGKAQDWLEGFDAGWAARTAYDEANASNQLEDAGV
jgi:hypothetical protein